MKGLPEAPCCLIGVEQLVGFVRKRLVKEVVVGLLDGGILVRKAHRVFPVDLIERFAAFPGEFHSLAERLTAAAGAAKNT